MFKKIKIRGPDDSGFTLIELLIVIVILGILAAALLSAINPLEQIRKSQDAGRKSDAAELLNAAERYYASYQFYPSGSASSELGLLPLPGASPVVASGVTGMLAALVTAGEVKPEFTARSNLSDVTNGVYVSLDAVDQIHTCFLPVSTTFTAQAATSTHCPTAVACICMPE